MAIPTTSLTYLQQGPVASGQQLAPSMLEMLELSFLGLTTIVLDGAATTATINYIDGTNALNFTPRAVLCFRTGGNALATILPYCVDNANAGVSATVTITAAGTSTNTIIVGVAVLK